MTRLCHQLPCQRISRLDGEEENVSGFLVDDIESAYLGKEDVCKRGTLNVILIEL